MGVNMAHLHLIVNHVPVIGTYGAILLLGVALLRGSSELTRLTLGLFVLLGLAAVAVFLTGEPAADEHAAALSPVSSDRSREADRDAEEVGDPVRTES